MTPLPPTIAAELVQSFGKLGPVTALTGGDVNHAVLVEAGTERMVVKWKPHAPPGLFEAEADGLERLRQAGAIRIPTVLAWNDAANPSWLALEYIPTPPPTDLRRFGCRFGEALATLHKTCPAPDGCFGLDRDNYLGSQPQRNAPTAGWADFYRDHRLLPQIERAQGLGWLPSDRERQLGEITERLPHLLDGFAATPVLIHGDLWSGNFLALGDDPVLIDPAVYYAEREIELAYTDLFGGFPPGFHAAYDAAFPLDSGYARRRPLHQLYPLLIHLNHFGETYGPRLDQACRAALRA